MSVASKLGALRQAGVALDQRIDGIGDLLLGEAAHLGDLAGNVLQIGVEGLGGVFGHHDHSPALVFGPQLQPKRPVM